MVAWSEYDRPVAPGPPWNRVSPENTARRDGAYRHTLPGEWPGVCSTRSGVAAISMTSSSARSPSGSVSG